MQDLLTTWYGTYYVVPGIVLVVQHSIAELLECIGRIL